MLDPLGVVSYVGEALPDAGLSIIPGTDHLAILISSADYVEPWILRVSGRP